MRSAGYQSMRDHLRLAGDATSSAYLRGQLFPLALGLGRHRLEILELGATGGFAQLS